MLTFLKTQVVKWGHLLGAAGHQARDVARQYPVLAVLLFLTVTLDFLRAALGASPKAMGPLTEQFHTAFFGLGLLATTAACVKCVVTGATVASDPRVFLAVLLRWLCPVLIGLSLIVLGHVQLEVALGWLVANPSTAMMLGLALLAVAAIGHWNKGPSEMLLSSAGQKFKFQDEPARVYNPSPETTFRTAVHEAGHALFLGLLPSIGEECRVLLWSPATASKMKANLDGCVSLTLPGHVVANELGLLLRMRMVLAGMLAERLVFGNATMGAASDLQAWSKMAHDYLSNGFAGPFVPQPSNEDHRQMNLEVMRQLHHDQEKAVQQFLLSNRDLLLEVATEAAQKKELVPSDIRRLLTPLRIPTGWKLPLLSEGTSS